MRQRINTPDSPGYIREKGDATLFCLGSNAPRPERERHAERAKRRSNAEPGRVLSWFPRRSGICNPDRSVC